MKIKLMKWKSLPAAAAFAAVAACGGVDKDSPEYQAHMQRHETMEALGDAILPLNQMTQEEIPVDDAVFVASARSLADAAANMLDGFDNSTPVADSRAKPEIWDNWDDFVAKAEALQTAATALAAAADSGGFAAGRELVRGVRDTCGGCHRPYRAAEED